MYIYVYELTVDVVRGFHGSKEAEKQDVQYSALRDPFFYPVAVFMPPGIP